ncbi:MAG TPA: hypothetical protein DCW83_08130 [Saprospirales bacterium]|nr:hypothetical protein [Saprospirales bacterium]
MANTSRNFIKGIMNKSLDERIIPNGQYIDALNVRMGSTEGSEVGVIENTKGNELLTSLSFEGNALSSSARCIGAYEDGANETLYWFIHDSNFPSSPTNKIDLIVSYDTKTSSTQYHIISIDSGLSDGNTTLNFNPKYLITGVNKIEELLYFTDNYTDPKQINVTKNYTNPESGVDTFSLESLLVIKKPPTTSPIIEPVTTSTTSNFLEDRFISFAYRYRYEDGEYSATSQFSNPAFIPGAFNYNFATALNGGMLNTKNAVNVTYNTGGPLVKSIDLLFKDMNSSVIKIIEKINKEEDGIPNNVERQYIFDNSKIFTVLPSSEILRLFDNVPRLADAQTLMGNRLMYGNYLEGYDLKDADGNVTKLEYVTTFDSEEVGLEQLSYANGPGLYNWVGSETIPKAVIQINFAGIELKAGSIINITLRFSFSKWSGAAPSPIEELQETTIDFAYTLQSDFNNPYELSIFPDFVQRIGEVGTIQTVENCSLGTTFTDIFNCSISNEVSIPSPVGGSAFKFASGISSGGQPIRIISAIGSNVISFQLPAMQYVDNVLAPTRSYYEYYQINLSSVYFQEVGDPKSLHSNRGYEIGIVYMDEFNRMTTALVSEQNTVQIPCSASVTKNSIQVNIPPTQIAPSWATRYKFVIKPDKEDYNVIYSNFFFRDPSSGSDYFLLEGQNSTKIELGDELIVKADTQGARQNCTWTTVLEKKAQQQDFLKPPPVDENANDILLPGGVYMKLQANNFSTELKPNSNISPGEIAESSSSGGTCPIVEYPTQLYNDLTNAWENIEILAGSRVSIRISNNRRGNESAMWGGVDKRNWEVDTSFISNDDYGSFYLWFNGDNIAPALESQAVEKIPTDWGFNYTDVLGGLSNDCNDTTISLAFIDYGANGGMRLQVKGSLGYSNEKKRTNLQVEISIILANSTIIFESDPQDASPDLWYESSESYSIDSLGQHTGNFQNQNFSANIPAIIRTAFFNCYAFGNGAESYKIQDSIIGKELVLGNRATTTDSEVYGEERRFSDITYSGVFNSESNINKLNEFNGGLLNFKKLETSFGPIRKLFARETDVLSLQEDKISYVLAGKNLLSDAAGGNALTSVPEVLGTQIARIEEFGISNNAESFAEWGSDKYFTDAKRGVVINLKGSSAQNEQLQVISSSGMRTWFRDLFNETFTSQKLGGFDPYMNEFVLSSNRIKKPTIEVCKNCGITESFVIKNGGYQYCYNVGELVGTVDVNYSVELPVTGTFEVIALYNGVVTTTGSVSTSGVLTFTKDEVLVNEVLISIIPTQSIDISLTVDCPIGDIVTIVLVNISNDADAGETIHDEYRWTDSTFQSPLHSSGVTFLSGPSPIVSLYETITGPQGGGVIPSNNATITIISDKKSTDTYDFNINSDNFRYLRTNILYANTTTQIQSLLLSSTIPTPINIPTGGNTAYTASFNMPNTGQYLYLIWDYRDATPIDLCYDNGTAQAACCNCPASSSIFLLEDCESGAQFTVEDTYQNGIGINSVVQYVQGVGAGAGTFVYCGRIINFGVTANATLYSNETQTCGDVSNCNFDSAVSCSQYTVSTYANTGQGYSYTDCNGVFRSEFIGGSNGYDSDTFCAQTGSVDPGSNYLSFDGDCQF